MAQSASDPTASIPKDVPDTVTVAGDVLPLDRIEALESRDDFDLVQLSRISAGLAESEAFVSCSSRAAACVQASVALDGHQSWASEEENSKYSNEQALDVVRGWTEAPPTKPEPAAPWPSQKEANGVSRLRMAVRLGGGLGVSMDSQDEVQANLANEGSEATVVRFDDSEQTFEVALRIGYALTPRATLGVELGYLDLGTYAISVQPRGESTAVTAAALEKAKPWGDDGALVGLYGQYRLTRSLLASVSGGVFLPSSTKYEARFPSGTETLEYDASGAAWSVGVNYTVWRNFDLAVQGRMVNINRWLGSSTVGLQYRF